MSSVGDVAVGRRRSMDEEPPTGVASRAVCSSTMRTPPRHSKIAALFALLLVMPSCRGCGSSSEPAGAMPQGLSVPVERDGRVLASIDQPLLDRTKPDYVDGDRKAWRLTSLLGAGSIDGRLVEVEDAEGVRTALSGPTDLTSGRDLVLTVNRAGALRMALTSGEDVFAAFHGRGGNRGRAGDPTRVREVRHIWLSSEG
jgi:hypothetical protein